MALTRLPIDAKDKNVPIENGDADTDVHPSVAVHDPSRLHNQLLSRFAIGDGPTAIFHGKSIGVEEVPPVPTFGSGYAQMSYDPDTRILTWSISFIGLSSEALTIQLYGPAMVGENGPVEIGIALRGRPIHSSINGSAMLTPGGAQDFYAAAVYLNIATKRYPAGELRGQLVPPRG